MSSFDPYHQWLGIPPNEQPPNRYRLLGLALFESDRNVIESAADRQMTFVRQHGIGQHSDASQKLLNEITQSLIVLLDPAKKSAYDATLKSAGAKAPAAGAGAASSKGSAPANRPSASPGGRTASPAKPDAASARAQRRKDLEALASLVPAAKRLIDRHDYAEAARLLEQVSIGDRTPEIQELLDQANELEEESDLLLSDLRRAVHNQQLEDIRENLDRLLELKPGNKFARELKESLETYGKGRSYRFDDKGRLLPVSDGGWFDGAKAAILVGVVAFVLMTVAVRIYLKDDRQTVTIEVSDDVLKDGTASLVVEGQTLELKGVGDTIKLRPGPNGYEVRRGDTVIVGPATFTVRKAEKNVLTIGIANVAATTTPSSEGTVPDGAAPPPAAAPFDAAMAKAHQAAWAKHLGFPVEFTNPVGMVFVLVPPGEYLRGSPDSDPAALANEKPQHRVRIDHALYVSRTEVTQTQFKAVTGSNPPGFYPGGGHGNRVNGVDTSAFPVESVNWLGASAFCETLQKKHPPTLAALGAQSYRLLTEAEWEYACRAGTTSRWSMTDDEAAAIKSVITGLNYKTLPRPVGGLPANAWGLFDMHGNIFEWCADGYSETEYAQLEGKTAVNPVRAPEGATRVARGGSWDTQPVQSRSAYRLSLKATDSGQSTGFRVCITVPVKGPEPAE